LLVATDLGYVTMKSEPTTRLFDDIDRAQAMLGRLIQVITEPTSTTD